MDDDVIITCIISSKSPERLRAAQESIEEQCDHHQIDHCFKAVNILPDDQQSLKMVFHFQQNPHQVCKDVMAGILRCVHEAGVIVISVSSLPIS
jgi:hypothetical protein